VALVVTFFMYSILPSCLCYGMLAAVTAGIGCGDGIGEMAGEMEGRKA